MHQRENLLLRQHRRQRVFGPRIGDLIGQRLVAERRGVEEAERADNRIDRARLQTAFEQMQAVCADVLDAELIRRRVMVSGKAGDGVGVALLRSRRHVAKGHVLDHALA